MNMILVCSWQLPVRMVRRCDLYVIADSDRRNLKDFGYKSQHTGRLHDNPAARAAAHSAPASAPHRRWPPRIAGPTSSEQRDLTMEDKIDYKLWLEEV